MTIDFQQIPNNVRVPLFYAELNNSQANSAQSGQPTLLIGQISNAGVATPNEPIQCAGVAYARKQCGAGSVLAQMAAAYLALDPLADLWLLPLADPGGGVKATGSLLFTGPLTANGTLSLYIADALISVPLLSGDTAAQVATAVVAAITATPNLAVVAAVDGEAAAQVDLTAVNAGTVGNAVGLAVNLGGFPRGQALPAGLAVAITAMTGGEGVPSPVTAFGNMSDQPADFIGHQFVDTTSIGDITSFLADVGGRWAYNVQIFGHAFGSVAANFSAAGTLGAELNDQHHTIMPVLDSPTPNWIWAAQLTARAALSLRNDPALPLQYLALPGVTAPPILARFDSVSGEQNALLYEGMSIFDVLQSGMVQILALITTYQLDAEDQPDNSYLYVTTMFSLMAILRGMKALVLGKYGQVKIVADGTRPPPNTNCISPSVVAADLQAWYQSQIPQLCQDAATFQATLVVEQNPDNPERLDVFAQPVLTGGLNIFALLNQFLLAPPNPVASN